MNFCANTVYPDDGVAMVKMRGVSFDVVHPLFGHLGGHHCSANQSGPKQCGPQFWKTDMVLLDQRQGGIICQTYVRAQGIATAGLYMSV